jgi:hypothetical protein
MALSSFHMLLVSLVLLLTFKDLVITKQSDGQKLESTDEELHHSTSHENEADSDFSSKTNNHHATNEFVDEQLSDNSESFVKKIPSLKIKSQQQTIKFLYW